MSFNQTSFPTLKAIGTLDLRTPASRWLWGGV